MKIKKRHRGIYSRTGATEILLLTVVVSLALGCAASDLLAYQSGDNLAQTNVPRPEGSRVGALALGLLAAFGLIVLLSLGGGVRGNEDRSCSEDKYRFLFEESPIANMIIGSDGTIKDVNRSVVHALGYSRDELIGKSALESAVLNQRKRLAHLLEDFDGEKSREIDVDMLARDGQVRTFLFSSGRIASAKESGPADVLVVGIDVTERKQAEQTLKKERQRLFSVLDIIPAFVYLQAPDYSVPFVNRRFRELFGDPQDQPCYRAFYGRGEPCDPCITLRVLRTRAPQSWEWTSGDGRTYLIHEDLFPGTDGQEMVMEIGIDITERKQAEEALRIGRERYALATQAARVGVWDWNLKTGEFYLDPNIKATLGYADEEIPNDLKTWTSYVHPDDREPVMEAAQAHLEGKTPDYVFEHRMRHKDGSDRWIMVRGKAIRDDSGSVVRMVGTDTDITGRKLAELAGARHTRNLEYLSEAAMGFVELPPEQGIYRFIGEQLKRIVPGAAYIAVNSFDSEKQKIRVECVLGGGGFIEAVWKTIGRDPTGMSFDISQEARQGLSRGKLTEVPGGLHELAFRQLPKIACSALEKLAGIGDIHVMGFAKKGELYGSAVLILQKDARLRDQDAIEALVRQAGVALQRRQAEEALHIEREKLESVTRNVGVGLAIISKDYRTLWANQVLTQLFGEVEGKPCHSTYNLRSDVCPGCGVREVLETGTDQVVHEQVGQDKDGKIIWSQIIATPIRDAQGNVTSALEVVVPITERKQNEQLQSVLFKIADATHTTKSLDELFRRIQRELGTVLDTRNFFVALYDKTTATLTLSYQVDEKEEFNSFPHGKTLTSWVIRNNQPLLCTEDVRAKLLEAEEVEPTGTPSKTWLGVPLKVEDEVIGVVGVQSYTDATAYGIKEMEILQFASGQIAAAIRRKQAEEELKSSEQRYRLLFERNLAAVYQTTLDGKVVNCNLSFARLLGYDSAEEVLTHNASEFYFDPAERESFVARLEEHGSLTDFEFRLRRRDGQPFWILENVNLIEGTGDLPSLIQGTCIDITQRKRAEDALRSSEDRYRGLFHDSPVSLWEEDFSEVKKHLDNLRAAGITDFRRYFQDHPKEVARCAAKVKVTDVNTASIKLYRAESAEKLRSALGSMLAKDAYQPFREELVRIAEGETSFESEAITYTLTGERKHVIMRWTVLAGYEETLSRVVLAMTAIP